jgi:hypothetical protein
MFSFSGLLQSWETTLHGGMRHFALLRSHCGACVPAILTNPYPAASFFVFTLCM